MEHIRNLEARIRSIRPTGLLVALIDVDGNLFHKVGHSNDGLCAQRSLMASKLETGFNVVVKFRSEPVGQSVFRRVQVG